MFYTKWMEELDKLDTPAVNEKRHKDFWYMLELSGSFIVWKPKIWLIHLFFTLMILLNLVFFIICDTVTVFKVDDIAIAGQAINYAAIILIALVLLVMVNVHRKNLIEMIETCLVGFYDYNDDAEIPDNIQKLKKKHERFKKILMFCVPVYASVVGSLVLLGDPIDTAFDYGIVNDSYVNGVYYKLPVKMWFFISIETDLDWLLLLTYMMFDALQLVFIIASGVFIMTFFGLELILQQNILVTACLQMDKRANALYRKRHGKPPPVHPLRRSGDRALMECYEYCLKQAVEHHRILLRFAANYMTLINWPAGIAVFNGSISIAMSAITFVQGGGKPSAMVTGTTLLLGELLSLFIVCEIGQTVKNTSEDLFDAIYGFKWMDCSKHMLQDVIIMKHLLRKPTVLLAGSLTPLDRDTFSTMLSTAYSYMNLLRASKGDAPSG